MDAGGLSYKGDQMEGSKKKKRQNRTNPIMPLFISTAEVLLMPAKKVQSAITLSSGFRHS